MSDNRYDTDNVPEGWKRIRRIGEGGQATAVHIRHQDGRDGVYRRIKPTLSPVDRERSHRKLLILYDAGVSNWQLPRWFYPDGNKPPLTYHPNRGRWRHDADHAYLRSVGRGQEFVLSLVHYPEAISWLYDLMDNLGSNARSR